MIYPDCETCQGKGTVLGSWMDANGRMQSEEVTCYRCQTRTHKEKPELRVANAQQVGGDHYKSKAIQPWDYIVGNGLGYLEGNVVKYVSRWKDKGGIRDLEKARHYLDKLIEGAK